MKQDLENTIKKVESLFSVLRHHAGFIITVLLLVAYGFLILRTNQLISKEPTSGQVDAQLQTVKRPQLDQSAVNKILQLQDQNVQVQSLFQHARDNPFSE